MNVGIRQAEVQLAREILLQIGSGGPRSFNLGVEIGQIVIVGALWPLLWWLNRQAVATSLRIVVSLLIFLLGAAWFCERTFGFKLLPI